jgi:hypothetical protein
MPEKYMKEEKNLNSETVKETGAVAQSCNHRYSRSKREWSDQGKSS